MSKPRSTKSQALLVGRVAKPAHLGNKHVAIGFKKIVLTLANYYIMSLFVRRKYVMLRMYVFSLSQVDSQINGSHQL